MAKSKEIYTYGFPEGQEWPEGVSPIPLDANANKPIEWPGDPIVVHLDSSAEFVSRVLDDKPGKLTTAVVVPQDKWVPPQRHLPYFNKRIPDGDKDAILNFANQEKQT